LNLLDADADAASAEDETDIAPMIRNNDLIKEISKTASLSTRFCLNSSISLDCFLSAMMNSDNVSSLIPM